MATDLIERRRREIALAAFNVFAERGYHNAGIADIARELGVGHGTFYRYFRNKRDIVAHVIDMAVGRIEEVVASEDPARANSLGEYRAQVERIGRALFDVFIEDPQLARIFFVESMAVDPALTERMLDANELFGTFTERYLVNGVEKGFLRRDLDTRVTALAINGMIFAGALAAVRAAEPARDRDRWVHAVSGVMFDGIHA